MTATATLNSTDTQYGTDTAAWSIRFGTKGAVTFNIITIRRDQVAKNDLVLRYGMLCIVTGATTADGWKNAAPNTRIYVSGNDWNAGDADEMITVYRKTETEIATNTEDVTMARQTAENAYNLNPTDANLTAYRAAADAEMDAVLAGFDTRHAGDTYSDGSRTENIDI